MFTEWTKKLAGARSVIVGWNMDGTGLKNREVLDKAETGICNKWYKPPASLPTQLFSSL